MSEGFMTIAVLVAVGAVVALMPWYLGYPIGALIFFQAVKGLGEPEQVKKEDLKEMAGVYDND